ncbi:MAG: tRNA (adenosine(37)-N6)-dimethylallyltransferase MiaA [Desulfuromonadaceae bacterium]|nr:tRNA (adenosine(37)-N6)-dimethylallyltransferase MiaA [Desulfuromonadaceae bacterium]
MSTITKGKILIICGPTASGKSDLAIRLAHNLDAEIVNADSMQMYRGLDIGTAKPSPAQQVDVPHHLIDVADPDQPLSAADFMGLADTAISDILSRGKRVIVVGGTGLYIRSLVYGLVDSPSGAGEIRQALHAEADRIGNDAMLERLRTVDPVLAADMHPNNLVRIIRALEVYELTGTPLSSHQKRHGFTTKRYETLQIAISVERAVLYKRINERVDRMLNDGLVKEVADLLDAGYGHDLKPMRSIGYKETAAFLRGEHSCAENTRLIQQNTRHYAKRQCTWFKADQDILWFEYPDKFGTILTNVIEFFE